MPDEKLISEARKLQREAKEILKKLGLLEILKKISKPKLVGSVVNGLIIIKDIDIHAYIQKYDISRIIALLPRLALLPTIQKVQFNNYRELRRDYRKDRVYFPHAYYIGLRSIQPSGEWKIDIWFVKKGEIQEYKNLNQGLTDKQQETILRLKKMWCIGDGYRDRATGIDFYKAVLDYKVRTPQDFKQYLRLKKSSAVG